MRNCKKIDVGRHTGEKRPSAAGGVGVGLIAPLEPFPTSMAGVQLGMGGRGRCAKANMLFRDMVLRMRGAAQVSRRSFFLDTYNNLH